MFVAMVMALVAISARLTVLQVGQADELEERGLDHRVSTAVLPAARGQILARDGERLALSTPASDVYADPSKVTDPWGTAAALSPLLGIDTPALAEAMTASDTTFVYLARQVEPDVSERVVDLRLPGIGFLGSTRRAYPAGPLAAQVLGFVGTDGEGLSGLELEYQDILAGVPGERTNEIGVSGQPIVGGVDVGREPVAGSSIVTTIDRELQYQAQVALAEAVEAEGAHGGCVIVMDPQTAEILVMANDPWFDPNAFAESPTATYRNRAVTDAFEPGSTNKVITAAAAIQEGSLSLNQRLSVSWTMQVGDYVIHDSHPHGVMQMTLGDIVAESSNIGAVHVANRVGAPTMSRYLARFGLGEPTGVGFPGESSGIVPPLSEWTDTSLPTIAYGQGLAATPLQMVSVFATIANGGRRMEPSFVRGTVGSDGRFVERDRAPARRVVSSATAEMVARMLAYAVEHGTGEHAQIPGYQVAGKTGTARIPTGDGSGYLTGDYVASFVGFLPARDPEVVIAVILDRPDAGYGGLVAAPLFRSVARAAITRLGIAPTDPLPLPPHALPLG
ncbi:MAG TPA: penicillin-binding protein 2 [Actinomycetota bacterium]|nr:penicillin-binding protein 2 [Actinomycetota bacterium]